MSRIIKNSQRSAKASQKLQPPTHSCMSFKFSLSRVKNFHVLEASRSDPCEIVHYVESNYLVNPDIAKKAHFHQADEPNKTSIKTPPIIHKQHPISVGTLDSTNRYNAKSSENQFSVEKRRAYDEEMVFPTNISLKPYAETQSENHNIVALLTHALKSGRGISSLLPHLSKEQVSLLLHSLKKDETVSTSSNPHFSASATIPTHNLDNKERIPGKGDYIPSNGTGMYHGEIESIHVCDDLTDLSQQHATRNQVKLHLTSTTCAPIAAEDSLLISSKGTFFGPIESATPDTAMGFSKYEYSREDTSKDLFSDNVFCSSLVSPQSSLSQLSCHGTSDVDDSGHSSQETDLAGGFYDQTNFQDNQSPFVRDIQLNGFSNELSHPHETIQPQSSLQNNGAFEMISSPLFGNEHWIPGFEELATDGLYDHYSSCFPNQSMPNDF